jgi:hypothetical protein
LDISSVTAAVARRWYVFLLVLALAGYVAVGAWQDAKPTYTSTTVLTILPSSDLVRVRAESNAGESSLGNPFGIGANAILASLLADQVNTGGIILPPEAGDAAVAVQAEGQDLRSFFTVQAVASTSDGAIAALIAVADQSPQVLAEMQLAAGAPGDQLYTALQTRGVTAPFADYPDRARLALGTALAGLLLATLLAVVVDSVLLARGRRRTRQADRDEGPHSGETGTPQYGRHHPPAPDVLTYEQGAASPPGPPAPNDEITTVPDGSTRYDAAPHRY